MKTISFLIGLLILFLSAISFAQESQSFIRIDEMVTHTMGLDDINTAFVLMHEGKSIRSVVIY